MRRLALSLLGLLILLGISGAADAQVSRLGSERVASFNSDISLARDGSAHITETIVYDFGFTPRHGIFRNVPVRSQEADGQKYYLEFTDASVTQDGTKATVAREDNSAQAILKIGDGGKTITGQHTYVINYTLKPVVRQANGSDFFTIDITGDEWKVPIEQAKAVIHYADGITEQKSTCTTGPPGSTAHDCVLTPQSDGIAVGALAPLPAGQGLTYAADLASGSVSEYLVAGKKPPIKWGRYAGFIVGGILLILAIVSLVIAAVTQWIRRGRETIVPLYEAPDGLSAAEIGYLTDNRGNLTEVTATLISLAVRGYLRIEQLTPPKLLRKGSYSLTQLKTGSDLPEWEKTVFDAVFAGGKTVKVADLSRSKMATAVSSFQSQLKKQLDEKGYYATPKTVKRLNAWGFLISLVIIGGTVAIHLTTDGGAAWLGSIGATIGGLVVFWLALNKQQATAAGAHEWSRVEGFKWFLTMTEKDRLNFTDAPKRNPKLFSAMLPYAVALEVEKEWAKQFEGIDIDKSTGWYNGNQPFTASLLANDISNSFSGVVSSNFTPVSSSSSGSGGSFSGGGVGGGGGGSW